MLSTIDQVNGLKPIMEIMSDPRKLMIEYNRAVEALKKKGEVVYIFDFELVKIFLRLVIYNLTSSD